MLRKGSVNMSVLTQLCVIAVICLVSEGVAAVLPFTFPASVIGMVILLILLLTKVLKPDGLRQTSDFFLGNMALFFVPTCVGVLKYLDVLLQNIWAVVLISILTTPLVFFVTGHVVQLTMKWLRKRGEKRA